MGDTIGSSVWWGAIFGTIATFTSALCLSCYWALKSHQAVDLAVLVLLWVPPVTIAGGIAATVLFGIVGTIMSFEPGGIKPSALSFAILASLLAFAVVILPFASWIAGGWHRAIHGAQGVYLLLPVVLLPVTIAALLTGWKLETAAKR